MTKPDEEWTPKDGGLRAWGVVAAIFVLVGVTLGFTRGFGVIYVELVRIYELRGYEDVAAKVSFVGSLREGTENLVAPITGAVIIILGHKTTSVIGMIISSLGFFFSYWLLYWVEALYFTLGIMTGVGTSFVCISAVAAVGFHFRQRLGIANGIAICSIPIFSALYPFVFDSLISKFGLPWTLVFMALLNLVSMSAILVYQVPEGAVEMLAKMNSTPTTWRDNFIHRDNMKNYKFLVFSLAMFFTWYGYLVPYIHITMFSELNFPGFDSPMLIVVIGMAGIPGSLIMGLLCDITKVNRILLMQIAVCVDGIFISLVPTAPNWYWLVGICLGIGVCHGAIWALIVPIFYEICGPHLAVQADALFDFISALAYIVGPVIAGHLYDRSASYTLSFLSTGIVMLMSTLILTAVYFIPQYKPQQYLLQHQDE